MAANLPDEGIHHQAYLSTLKPNVPPIDQDAAPQWGLAICIPQLA